MSLKIYALVIVMALVLATSVMAVNEEKKEAKGNELNARYAHLECRANLAAAQVDSLVKYELGTENMASLKEKITADLATLKGYAEAGSAAEFNSYVKDTIKTDWKSMQDSIKEARKNIKVSNLVKETRQALKDAWKASVASFAECNSNAKREVVKARKAFMDAQVEQWNSVVSNMKEKGLDTAEEEKVVEDAGELTTLLEEAANAETDDAMKEKVNEARALHLHLWARFHIAKVNSYLAKVEPRAVEAGLSAKVDEIKSLLASASEKAKAGEKYDEGDFKATWQDIKDASSKLKELVKELKDAKKAAKATETPEAAAQEG